MNMPSVPKPPATKLRSRIVRNPRRGRLGGVCAGLADFMGWDRNLIRLFFLLSFLFGGLGFGIYMALWIALPAVHEAPIPKVSGPLRAELRKIQKQIDLLNKKTDPRIADMAVESFESIKLLAPGFEPSGDAPVDSTLREMALAGFPILLDSILKLPSHAIELAQSGDHAGSGLIEQLDNLRQTFESAVTARMERTAMASITPLETDKSELSEWRKMLEPLQISLSERSTPETLSLLKNIEDKLGFLMNGEHQPQGDLLDLRPFEIRKIAFEYLPETLNEYLRLPSNMVQSQPLQGEKTAEQVLNEQLTLLDTSLHDLAKSLFEQDGKRLLIQGRFLKEKFADQPFQFVSRSQEHS